METDSAEYIKLLDDNGNLLVEFDGIKWRFYTSENCIVFDHKPIDYECGGVGQRPMKYCEFDDVVLYYPDFCSQVLGLLEKLGDLKMLVGKISQKSTRLKRLFENYFQQSNEFWKQLSRDKIETTISKFQHTRPRLAVGLQKILDPNNFIYRDNFFLRRGIYGICDLHNINLQERDIYSIAQYITKELISSRNWEGEKFNRFYMGRFGNSPYPNYGNSLGGFLFANHSFNKEVYCPECCQQHGDWYARMRSGLNERYRLASSIVSGDMTVQQLLREVTIPLGKIEIIFESLMDERPYAFGRDLLGEYYIYDPRLKMRICTEKEEVQNFVRQNQLLDTITDLDVLLGKLKLGRYCNNCYSIFTEDQECYCTESAPLDLFDLSFLDIAIDIDYLRRIEAEIENEQEAEKPSESEYSLRFAKLEEQKLVSSSEKSEKETWYRKLWQWGKNKKSM